MPFPASDLPLDHAAHLSRVFTAGWHMLRGLEPGLPDAQLFPHYTMIRKSPRWCDFALSTWHLKEMVQHPAGVRAVFFTTPEDALLALLHEAAHGLLWEGGEQGGCTPDGEFHRV